MLLQGLVSWQTARGKCPYSEFFWFVISQILTEYGHLLCKSLDSVGIQKNATRKNSKYGHFFRSEYRYTLFSYTQTDITLFSSTTE